MIADTIKTARMSLRLSDGVWTFRIRLIAFIAILAFMVVGPIYRQVLGGENKIFRNWVMFSGAGLGVIDATFRQRLSDGTEIELDRFKVLGYNDPRKAPKNIWRIKGKSMTYEVAKQLCSKLDPGADIRVTSRWGSRQGWKAGYRGDKNICELPETKKKRKRS